MKSFRVDKVVRSGGTNCVGESRLGTVQLSIPSDSNPNDEAASTTSSLKNEDGKACNVSMEQCVYRTPMYLVHTQSGSIPHVTPEVLELIYPTRTSIPAGSSLVPPLQISIESTVKCVDSIRKFGKGVGKFVGLPDVPTFLTVHDPLQPLKSDHNDKFGIALWSRQGRSSLTPQRFIETVNSYKPSLCQILSDYDVRPESTGMKRLQKSLARAEEYTDFVVKEKCSDKKCNPKVAGLFITIESAWFEMDEDKARKTVKNLLEAQHQIEGVVITGLIDRFDKCVSQSNSDHKRTDEQLKVDLYQDLNTEILDKIGQLLPPGLPKYIPGPFGLAQMVDLVSKGVDILDSSVTTKMADNAEIFLLDNVEAVLSSVTTSVKNINAEENEGLPERCERVHDLDKKAQGPQEVASGAVISLKDKQFFDDFQPLSKSCTCYTCRKHTRSYVHHLYATDELLGPVLVQIHNLTALDRFFHIIRGIVQDTDTTEDIHEKFKKIKTLVSHKPVKTVSCDDDSNIEVVKANGT